MIPIVIFENNEAYRKSLELFFEEFPGIHVAGSFNDGTNAARKMQDCGALLALMDIDMPVMNGIAATKNIKEAKPDTLILILTVFEDNDRVFDAICAGADGYLLKSTPPHEIVRSIQDTINGGSPMTPSVARKVLQLFSPAGQLQKSKAIQNPLTEKEKIVLQQLVEGNSYKMIADTLDISIDTVRFHIRNIYAKLHVNSATEAVAMALRKKLF